MSTFIDASGSTKTRRCRLVRMALVDRNGKTYDKVFKHNFAITTFCEAWFKCKQPMPEHVQHAPFDSRSGPFECEFCAVASQLLRFGYDLYGNFGVSEESTGELAKSPRFVIEAGYLPGPFKSIAEFDAAREQLWRLRASIGLSTKFANDPL